ncbi:MULTISPECIES: hypothetical protein [Blautia]|jgi:hypothetical protein|uniref:Uncharacterized protein n=1 Tax=Blautia difficilis TaxID=2763027 RepID=A0ABR7ILT1_9FIRM|nr:MULTISPECIES: hypothetical protein [Blautia]MBC5780988.1 hypothetical protein [Blautia difficilis]MBE5703399.1 hypothetical protein [Ruminococcus sp.]MBE5705360.1 hypothetical protein [Ruminococcus sp.]
MKIPKEKTVRATAIPVNPKEVILPARRVLHRVHTMFIIMMTRMISLMTGQRNLVEEIMMADMIMRMIIGRRTTGNNNVRKLWR